MTNNNDEREARISDLRAAIEGECDGLAATYQQAASIIDYMDSEQAARQPAAATGHPPRVTQEMVEAQLAGLEVLQKQLARREARLSEREAAATGQETSQTADAVAWFIADDNGDVYATTGYEFERDGWRATGHEVFPLYAALIADNRAGVEGGGAPEWALRVTVKEQAQEMDEVRAALGLPDDCDYSDVIAEIERLKSTTNPSQPAETIHTSDCATHNEPAYPNGPCDCGASQPAESKRAALTNEQITDIWNSMPGGCDGFLKSWGYIQFARALLAASEACDRNAVIEEIGRALIDAGEHNAYEIVYRALRQPEGS
jgi:hypothetical protein